MTNSLKSLAKNLESTDNKFSRLQGIFDAQQENYKIARRAIKSLEKDKLNLFEAVKIIQEVARATQQELECEVSEIVTSAIQAIFKEDHSLRINFEMKRNKTEAEVFVQDENGNNLDLYNDDGGGLIDIVTFSLRLACWRIKSNKTSPIFLFDEPWKNLSKKFRPAAMQFMKDISEKMDAQIIMITHVSDFIEVADKVIEIK